MSREAQAKSGRPGALAKGWCPGALRPMAAKDGLIVRARPRGARLDAASARTLASAARKFGSGALELTSRANLQLRGVDANTLPGVWDALASLGLLDASADAEAVRNVMLSPLTGLVGEIDLAPLAAALEAALADAADLHALPAKFGFALDDGGPLSIAREPADTRFLYDPQRGLFAIVAGSGQTGVGLGACAPGDLSACALSIARAFLFARAGLDDAPRRMGDLIAAGAAPRLAALCGRALTAPPALRPAPHPPVGRLDFGAQACFGASAPFGRLSASMLEAAAQAAERFGAGEMRLTPWRTLVLPHIRPSADIALSAMLAAAGFIVSPGDPRLAVAACGGAVSCERGSTPAQDDALALAALARALHPEGVALHVAGCVKGCARTRAAPLTLNAHDGVYDLIQGGAPSDPPFATNLSLTAARDLLHAMAMNAEDDAEGRKQRAQRHERA